MRRMKRGTKRYGSQRRGSAKRSRVSSKISKLRHEGKPPDQSVAMALSMERAGRLTPGGGYIRAKRKKGAGTRSSSGSRRS